MTANFRLTGIDWEDRGYFGCPDRLPAGTDSSDPWNRWLIAFHRAKLGDFTYVPALRQVLLESEDWLLVTTCSDLLGDAGTDACLDSLLGAVREAPFVRACEISHALYLRGRLSDIPTLVNVYEKFSDVRDADIIPLWIADLLQAGERSLSEANHFEDAEDYREAVLEAYQRLTDDLGSDQVYVFQGKLFGMTALAQDIRARVRRPFVRSILRHKFEASTGVDCSSFYKRGELRPLAAAAIVEAFLESGAVSTYKDGIRYFFGHAIPD